MIVVVLTIGVFAVGGWAYGMACYVKSRNQV